MRGPGVAASSWQFSIKATIQPTRRLHPQTSHRSAQWRLRTDTGATGGVAGGASHGSGGHFLLGGASSAWCQARGGEVSTGKSLRFLYARNAPRGPWVVAHRQCSGTNPGVWRRRNPGGSWSGRGGFDLDQTMHTGPGINAQPVASGRAFGFRNDAGSRAEFEFP